MASAPTLISRAYFIGVVCYQLFFEFGYPTIGEEFFNLLLLLHDFIAVRIHNRVILVPVAHFAVLAGEPFEFGIRRIQEGTRSTYLEGIIGDRRVRGARGIRGIRGNCLGTESSTCLFIKDGLFNGI